MKRSARMEFGALTLSLLLPVAAQAQSWLISPHAQASVTATTNSNDATSGSAQSDVITSLKPEIDITNGDSARVRVHMRVGADLVAYAHGSQPNRIYPLLIADERAALVEHLLFFDSGVSVRGVERDPYAAREQAGTSQNRQMSSVYRVSPYVQYALSKTDNFLAQYEEMYTHGGTTTGSDQRFSNVHLRLARLPVPLGGFADFESRTTRFPGVTASQWRVDSLKAGIDFGIGKELIVGPVVGKERTSLFLQDHSDSLYGAHLEWTPSERTRVAAEAGRRFFGSGWTIDAQHRSPYFLLAFHWGRAPVNRVAIAGSGVVGSDLGSVLNAILTTRIPDAAAREVAVNGLIASRGLATDVQGPIEIRADYAQLQNDLRTAVTLLGSRNIVTLTVYARSLRQLQRAGDTTFNLVTPSADNRQFGATLSLNRKLTPELTFDLTTSWSQITGIAARLGDQSTDRIVRSSLARQLAPRTALVVGLQHERLATNVTTGVSFNATSAYVGLNQRF